MLKHSKTNEFVIFEGFYNDILAFNLNSSRNIQFNLDRLRAVQCPTDIADQIGGSATEGVGQGYGSGYPIEVLMEWIEKTVAATEVG